ncbi:MAG: ATP-binding protein [Coriobacteriales bacterium]|nr:ATP-binding protein [Coriobacteriales bacterium]
MADSVIRLSVPAEPEYARSVRMMAANLAVLCSMNVDEVEDARMAAEEAFVYACATRPHACEVTFNVSADSLSMVFLLGDVLPSENEEIAEQISMAELLLSAVSDEYQILQDSSELHVTKLVGVVHDA